MRGICTKFFEIFFAEKFNKEAEKALSTMSCGISCGKPQGLPNFPNLERKKRGEKGLFPQGPGKNSVDRQGGFTL